MRDLQQDQFLRIVQAEEDHIMTYEITIDDVDASQAAAGDRLQTYFEEIKQLYHRVRDSLEPTLEVYKFLVCI